jgi:hypothetical protein
MENTPPIFQTALQGLCFWMGHRQSLYHDWPLQEGALVAELANLLAAANKDRNWKIQCEEQYKNVSDTNGRTRADICIWENEKPLYLVEVKRYSAPQEKIDEDLKKLAEAMRETPDMRCFLVLTSEKQRPKERYVGKNGKAAVASIPIDGHFTAKVRRVLKASASFEKKDHAHYACLLEVVPPSKKS